MIRPFALAALAALTLSGTAGAAGPAPGCFRPDQIVNWRAADDRTVYLRLRNHDIYKLTARGHCPDLAFNPRLTFNTRGRSSLCSPLDLNLVVPTAIGPFQCPVDALRRLTPEEAGALSKHDRP